MCAPGPSSGTVPVQGQVAVVEGTETIQGKCSGDSIMPVTERQPAQPETGRGQQGFWEGSPRERMEIKLVRQKG